jgi:AcrR family transcriptional regulator/DNA-binding MarR family transcriptional regulator
MLAAAVQAVTEVGYARMTVAHVISRAGVSRKTFYDMFADREDCFRAAFEQALTEATLSARRAYERESGWREGTRSALTLLLVAMDCDRRLARLVLIESLAAGPAVWRLRAQLLQELVEMIDQGRVMTTVTNDPPPLTAQATVGGVCALLQARLLEERDEPLTDLLGPLMSVIVMPYLGAHAAAHELGIPAPTRRPPRRSTDEDGASPLAAVHMRLTYRTAQVLRAIAAQPGASNRQVAERAGVKDQGQISKLLSRLAGLGLVENFGDGKEKGAANAWRLTAPGRALERATRPREPHDPPRSDTRVE